VKVLEVLPLFQLMFCALPLVIVARIDIRTTQ
jgi:hypothetical protein